MLKLKEKLFPLFCLTLCTCSLQHDFWLSVLENVLFFYSSCLTTLFRGPERSSNALFEGSCVTAFSVGNEGLCHVCAHVPGQVQEWQTGRQGELVRTEAQPQHCKMCVGSGLTQHHQQQQRLPSQEMTIVQMMQQCQNRGGKSFFQKDWSLIKKKCLPDICLGYLI